MLAWAAILASPACTRGPKPVDLTRALGQLEEASAAGRTRDWVEHQTRKALRVNDVVEQVLPAWPPSRLRFKVKVPKKAKLNFSYAILPEGAAPGGVDFSVHIGSESLWKGHLDPSVHPSRHHWYPAEVDLARFSGQTVDLILETHVFAEASNPPRAFWGNPALTSTSYPSPLAIVYLVDTLRADHTGPYGYTRDTTPFLNAFSKDAVVYDTAIAQASWTKPSVASLMTSLLPGQHRAVQLRDPLDPNLNTIAKRLSSSGYSTGASIANSVIYSEGTNFDQGFDFFAGLHGPHNRPSKLVEAGVVVDAALSFIDARRGFPAFLYVHTMDPHVPYSPPAPFDRKFEPYPTPDHPASDPRTDFKEPLDRDRLIAQYDGDVAYGDQEFGRFIQGLKERGVYDQALIIFMADHGEEFQDHGQWLHGRSVYDELIRIPLIVKFPEKAHAGERIQTQVQEVDVLPTILANAGIPVPTPPEILGHPLQEVFAGVRTDILAISEISHRGYVAQGIRSNLDKYVQRFSPEEGQLYFDLLKDPKELENRLDRNAERARKLRAILERGMTPNPFENHLRILGSGEYVLRLRTGGWFEKVEAESLGPADKSEREDNNRKLFVTIHGESGRAREVTFGVRPTGAPVFVEGTRDGRPLLPSDIFCGADGEHPEVIPARFPEVEGVDEKHLKNDVLNPPRKVTPGLQLWLTPTRRLLGPLSKNDCEQMKALGYIADCPDAPAR